MKIYVSHLRRGDYKKELYEPLRNSQIADFIFPHENSDEPFDSKSVFQNKGCDLVLAEVSTSSTGQGIELGWANVYGIKIICIYKQGSQIASSFKIICNDFIEYTDPQDLLTKLVLVVR